MSYTQSFVGETEFDKQALSLDPGQAGVPLWKIYDPRSVGLPSNLRYDLSGLGDFGLATDLKQAGEDCAKAKVNFQLGQGVGPALTGRVPDFLLARLAERERATCAHYKSLQSGSTPDPRAQSDDSGGLPKWALPAAIAVAAVVVVGFVL